MSAFDDIRRDLAPDLEAAVEAQTAPVLTPKQKASGVDHVRKHIAAAFEKAREAHRPKPRLTTSKLPRKPLVPRPDFAALCEPLLKAAGANVPEIETVEYRNRHVLHDLGEIEVHGTGDFQAKARFLMQAALHAPKPRGKK